MPAAMSRGCVACSLSSSADATFFGAGVDDAGRRPGVGEARLVGEGELLALAAEAGVRGGGGLGELRDGGGARDEDRGAVAGQLFVPVGEFGGRGRRLPGCA